MSPLLVAALSLCSDVTILNVNLEDPMMFDIVIVDISHATDAVFLFWQPMLDWVEDHNHREAPEDIEQLAASR